MRLKNIVFLFFLIPITFLAADESGFDTSYSEYIPGIRRNQGRTVGCDKSYTTAELLAFPFSAQNLWPFLDLRAHYFDKGDRYAANAGLGCRFAPKCLNQIFGVNAYYDCREIQHHNFNQIGLGFEWLGECWNFRLNGYLPVGKRKVLKSSHLFDEFVGGFFLLKEHFLTALRGVNFEIEARLARTCWADIYLAIGPYYYTGNKCRDHIYGSEYRLTAQYCDRIYLSLLATYDCEFKSRVQGELALRFPIKWGCGCPCDRIFQPIRRHEIIVRDRYCTWTSNF